MPIQVLPYVQSPLEQLAPHIQQAAGLVGQSFGNIQNQKRDQSILQQIQSGTVTPANTYTLWSQLSPEARKTYEPFLASELRKQEATHKENVKTESERAEKMLKAETVLSVADEMKGLLKYTGSTRIPFTASFNASENGLNREGLQKREHFDELAASAASFFRDLETKGQLPLGLYQKVIEPRLPSSKLSERQNLGRIEGLESLARKYGGLEAPKVSSKSESTPKEGKKLTVDIVSKWKEEGLSKEQAEKRAKELGYEF